MPNKRYKLACAPIEDSDQTAQMHSLIRVFDGYSLGSQWFNVSSCRKLRHWSDGADVQTGKNLCCMHTWVKVFRIIPEFRILRLTFHRK